MSAQPSDLVAPFPWFGGKSRIADEVWRRLGDVQNYVEPFAGSLAVLLKRPQAHDWARRIETCNDLDGLISNFWRAVQAAPDEVAHWADWPCNENDLHARHAWLVGRKDSLQAALEGDPEYFDAKVAGWYLWGLCLWIGSGWCAGEGPWQVQEGRLVRSGGALGVKRQRVHLGNAGMGIHRKLVHLGNAGRGECAAWSEHLAVMMGRLSDRLRRVRVACGDWSRVCGPTPTVHRGLTGVFLDPPYSHAERDDRCYRQELACAEAVREWAIARGDDSRIRIALCGYEGEHVMPDTWTCERWKAHGGYGSQGAGRARGNASREVIWFSPHCLGRRQPRLFA